MSSVSTPPSCEQSDPAEVRDQLALENARDNRQYNFALASLEANARDRDAARDHMTLIVKSRQRFILLVLSVSLVFVGGLLAIGKDAIVIELLKDAALALGGGGVGYSICIKRVHDAQRRE